MFVLFLLTTAGVSAEDNRFVRVSSANPDYFELDDGSPYIPIGLNLCSIGLTPNADAGMKKIEFYFQKLSENGGNYARIWLSCPLFEIEKDAPGHFDKAAVQRVREMIRLAGKYNIRLKLCFEHFRNIGEMEPGWCRKAFYRLDPPSNIKEFVNSEFGKNCYLRRCEQFKIFKDNPYIFGWEIWNEMNCLPDFVPFTEYVLPKLHKMFPRQMTMQSLGSYDTARVYSLYQMINTMPGNDVAQIHRYLDPGASLPECKGAMDLLCADAVGIMKKIKPGRPILLAETGAVEKSHSGPSKLYSLDKEGLLLHDALFVPFFCGAAGSGHIWHWNCYVEANDLWYHFGRFAQAVEKINPIEEKFEPFQLKSGFLRAYGLRGQKNILIFLRDQETNWQTELINKTAAPVRKKISFDLTKIVSGDLSCVRCYDPWKDRQTELSVKNGQIVLPEFRRSLVLYCSPSKFSGLNP